jgi:diphthamide synthase (EF-2-diphthine--ammonia ligase)
MFHHPAIEWTKLQAEAIGLPQILVKTRGVKEEELFDLKRAFKLANDSYSIEAAYTGALASVYQKSRVERIFS